MLLLGIDIGTTNCKAGVFSTTGASVSMASTKAPLRGDRSCEFHTLVEGPFPPSPALKSFQFGKYLSAAYTYVDAGLMSSGLAVDWSEKRFALLPDCEDVVNPHSVPQADIAQKLAGMSHDAEPLLFLPHLRGGGYPERDPDSRGALIGLRPFHTARHIFKAVVEAFVSKRGRGSTP